MIPLAHLDRNKILEIAARHGMYRVRVFGSFARGEATPISDLDLLVDVARGKSYLDLIAFTQELEDLLGRRVDVLTEAGVSPYLREEILATAKPL